MDVPMPTSSSQNGDDWPMKSCSYSYNNLFNLEPLVNLRNPEEFDDYVSISSSQDGSEYNASRGNSRMVSEEDKPDEGHTTKRKREDAGCASGLRDDGDSNDSVPLISEDHYQEHVQKNKRTCLPQARFYSGSGSGSGSLQFDPQPGSSGGRGPMLDLCEGMKLVIPPSYEQLIHTTGLPDLSATMIDEAVLSSQLTPQTLETVIESDRKFKGKARTTSNNSKRKFTLRVEASAAAAEQPEQPKMDDVKVIERGENYEVIQRRIPKKQPSTKTEDEIAIEDVEKVAKYWVSIVRKELPKHYKGFITFHKKATTDHKRFADSCVKEVILRETKSRPKTVKSTKTGPPTRNRKLTRDMVNFYRKLDKEMAETKKRVEKDAAEALKRDEELREALRAQQRLNFLLTQTEIYSHFMQNKSEQTKQPTETSPGTPSGEPETEEDKQLRSEALEVARKAASEQKEKTSIFDEEILQLRLGAPEADGEKIDLLNPSTMPAASSVNQPSMFHGVLKEYQLKGLQWLVNCYEQGLNGILADEMGLGKTIQAMAFLAHLAEEKNIWGPFLVVAPASVLPNWADEIKRFCPDLKILPYWDAQRTLLRKNITPKRLYRRDSSFHILITSYQLLVTDEKYFKRVKWQYMVLDEAQAIKSAASNRWKTLKSFSCRNRLLLTGTPIQNNMAELWALLHFIMPGLFDNPDQFNEWFSRGIENHAEHGGTLNEHQLTRLHAILKPFMLRRVKKDVISELTNKKEVVVSCNLSSRQQAIYQAVKNKISIAELFVGGHLNEKKVVNLMNIVIQLRKVCNHPELFEKNEGRTYYHFAALPNNLLPPAFGEAEHVYYSGGNNPISYKIPKLVYRDAIPLLPALACGSPQGLYEKWVSNLLNVYSGANVHSSIFDDNSDGCFGFSRLIDLSPTEVSFLSKASLLERWQFAAYRQPLEEFEDEKSAAISRLLLIPTRSESAMLRRKVPTGLQLDPFEALVVPWEQRFLSSIQLLRSVKAFIPPAQAPQISLLCADTSFSFQRAEEMNNPWVKRLLVGFSRTSEYNGPAVPLPTHHLIEEVDTKINGRNALLSSSFQIFGSAPPLQNFDFARTLMDSGKLQALDSLLRRLRAENHRVLVFAQMVKMLNILEAYMVYRKYKYLRLDGSSTIVDRRDMVKDFQHRSDIFVFLLSTRAGGLGINLTAADTVIFYESDWNPTMDLQAMDRAHRLGQTKEVTVYRLICKNTVEEKILKRANQKNTVQQLVMTGGQTSKDVFEADEVVSLLLDDAELEQRLKHQPPDQKRKSTASKKKVVSIDADGTVSLQDEAAGTDTTPKPAAPSPAGSKVTPASGGTKAPSKRKPAQKRPAPADNPNPKPPKTPKTTPKEKEPAKPKSKARSSNKKGAAAAQPAAAAVAAATANHGVDGGFQLNRCNSRGKAVETET